MKIKNIEKRGNRKEGVNLIIEVLEKDVIPKGNRKLLNRRNFYKQHLTSLGFSHVRGKYVIQLDDEKNLTASCETCNKKKGQKLSLSYVLRGILGRKSWYWIIYYIVIIVVLVIVILQIVNP